MPAYNKIKAGIIFGLFITIIFMLPRLLSINTASGKTIFLLIFSSLFIGASFGALFFWVSGLLVKHKFRLESHEVLLFSTPASNFNGLEAAAGWLYLTNDGLFFNLIK